MGFYAMHVIDNRKKKIVQKAPLDKEAIKKRKKMALTHGTLIRKNINSLSSSEFKRFCRAFDELQNNGEFTRIAKIHEDYCRHGISGFGLFHRA